MNLLGYKYSKAADTADLSNVIPRRNDFPYNSQELTRLPLQSPAFVYSAAKLVTACQSLRAGIGDSTAKVLYATKSCALEAILNILNPYLDGFAVASPAEAYLAARSTGTSRSLHITTPGFKPAWFDGSLDFTHAALNSITQLETFSELIPRSVSVGVRVNPGHSNVADERYDPCRQYSKLGVGLNELASYLKKQPIRKVKGLHFHNACLGESWTGLRDTVFRIAANLDFVLRRLEWINLGGGIIWDEITDFQPLREAVDFLTETYGLEVFIEPGAGFVNSAGYLVASVIDLFESEGKAVAILDTTVNHLPEVFEYQFEPDIAEHVNGARNEYILAGCSCLAGDVFGEYAFDEPLRVGSRLTFENVGAYSIVKAHMFNGIDLPSIHVLGQSGDLELIKESSLDDFVGRFGSRSNEYAHS